MQSKIDRRAFLAGTAGAGIASLAGGQAWAQAKKSIAVRIDRDAEVLDPAFRSGLQDGNIVRSIHQRLVTLQPGTTELATTQRRSSSRSPARSYRSG